MRREVVFGFCACVVACLLMNCSGVDGNYGVSSYDTQPISTFSVRDTPAQSIGRSELEYRVEQLEKRVRGQEMDLSILNRRVAALQLEVASK